MNLQLPEPVVLTAITVLAGFAGIVLGAFLTPIFADWFQRRRKTIRLTVNQIAEFKTPVDDVSFEWRDHRFTKLNNVTFTLRNMTGRTIRNFSLNISVPHKSSSDDFVYMTLVETDGVKFEATKAEGDEVLYNFQYFEPNPVITGYVISSYAKSISATTMDDFEIEQTSGAKAGARFDIINKAVTGLAAAGMAAAIINLLGA